MVEIAAGVYRCDECDEALWAPLRRWRRVRTLRGSWRWQFAGKGDDTPQQPKVQQQRDLL